MEQKEKQTLNSRVTSFIVKTRIPIIVILVVLIIGAIGASVAIAVMNNNVVAGLTNLDSIEFRYESLDRTSDTYANDQEQLVSEAIALADNSSGVVKVRSLLFSADVKFELENWSEARELYVSAYEEDMSSYTASVALYNAAVASEELNEIDMAIEYLNMLVDTENFSLMARALFNLGRLEETSGNYQLAVDTYQKLNDDFPSTSWASLANSRIIVLQAENKAE